MSNRASRKHPHPTTPATTPRPAPPPAKNLYWNALSPAERETFLSANRHDLDDEIALLRAIIGRDLAEDSCDRTVLVRELSLLERLQRADLLLKRESQMARSDILEIRSCKTNQARNGGQ